MKKQEIKLELLKIFASSKNPVEECRKALEFMEEDVESPVSEDKPADGIYLVYADGHHVLFESNIPKPSKGVTGIGVVYDGHAFQVALQDLGEQPLIREGNNSSPDESPFYKTECEGLHDWDFVGATNHLRECGMDMPLPEGWYIPTLAVLEAMCFLKEKINEAIKFAGGEPMPDDFHWSSTESNRSSARGVYFSSGGANRYGKYGSYVVRPVTAFDIEA